MKKVRLSLICCLLTRERAKTKCPQQAWMPLPSREILPATQSGCVFNFVHPPTQPFSIPVISKLWSQGAGVYPSRHVCPLAHHNSSEPGCCTDTILANKVYPRLFFHYLRSLALRGQILLEQLYPESATQNTNHTVVSNAENYLTAGLAITIVAMSTLWHHATSQAGCKELFFPCGLLRWHHGAEAKSLWT